MSQHKVQYNFIFFALETHLLCTYISFFFFPKILLCALLRKVMLCCSCLPTPPASLSSSVMVFILFLINHMFVLFTVCQFLSNLQYFYGTINVILSLLFFPTSLLTIISKEHKSHNKFESLIQIQSHCIRYRSRPVCLLQAIFVGLYCNSKEWKSEE